MVPDLICQRVYTFIHLLVCFIVIGQSVYRGHVMHVWRSLHAVVIGSAYAMICCCTLTWGTRLICFVSFSVLLCMCVGLFTPGVCFLRPISNVTVSSSLIVAFRFVARLRTIAQLHRSFATVVSCCSTSWGGRLHELHCEGSVVTRTAARWKPEDLVILDRNLTGKSFIVPSVWARRRK